MKIAIAGCGNIGETYARTFLKLEDVEIILPARDNAQAEKLKMKDLGKVIPYDDEITACDVVVLSVKPQEFLNVGKMLRYKIGTDAIVISVMAGITIAQIQTELEHAQVLRTMPNAAVEVGLGMTGLTASKEVTAENLQKAEALLAGTGKTFYFNDENLLDAVTALSGSGPAYFYYMLKYMGQAGVKMGMDEATAVMFARQTMLGAVHLYDKSGKTPAELISVVASKGGTTEAALHVFDSAQVGNNIAAGILQACKRAQELSK